MNMDEAMGANMDIGQAGNSRLPVFDANTCPEDLERMMRNAQRASNFLKAISHEGRLMILCHLASGEKSVTELEDLLAARQAAVSQQLSRLRLEGLVTPRRDGNGRDPSCELPPEASGGGTGHHGRVPGIHKAHRECTQQHLPPTPSRVGIDMDDRSFRNNGVVEIRHGIDE